MPVTFTRIAGLASGPSRHHLNRRSRAPHQTRTHASRGQVRSHGEGRRPAGTPLTRRSLLEQVRERRRWDAAEEVGHLRPQSDSDCHPREVRTLEDRHEGPCELALEDTRPRIVR